MVAAMALCGAVLLVVSATGTASAQQLQSTANPTTPGTNELFGGRVRFGFSHAGTEAIAKENLGGDGFMLFDSSEAGEFWRSEAGKIRELGGQFDFGSLGLGFKHRAVAGLNTDREEYSGTVGIGLVDLSFGRSIDTTSDPENPGIGTTRRLIHSGDLSLDLERYRGLGVTGLIPSMVTIGGSMGDLTSGSLGASDRELGLGVGLGWDGDASSTTIDVWRDFTDSRAAGLESADNEYWTVDLGQDFYGDTWDFSLYVSYSQSDYLEIGAGSLERDISGGASFSLYQDKLPDFTLSFDLGGYQMSEVDYASVDTSMMFGFSLDFSKFLPAGEDDFVPYLTLNYYAEQLNSKDSDTGSTSQWGHAAMVKLGTQF